MAGARPSSFKAGGGFLNNVDGVLQDYEFTTEFPGGEGKKSKKKNSDFTALYFVLTVAVDGVDDPAVTTLFVGSADDFEIENDGKTLTPVDETSGLRQNSDFYKFINSLVEAGFPESSLPEDEINFEAILGSRVRLVQQVDEEATARLGKKKSKDGKKEYSRTWLKVASVAALPGKGGKATGKADSKGKSKGKAAEADDEEDEVTTLATESLLALLKKAPKNTILKKKLPVQIMNQVGAKHPQREAVRKMVTSDDFLSAGDGWSYDDESQEITLD